jgi:DNA primase
MASGVQKSARPATVPFRSANLAGRAGALEVWKTIRNDQVSRNAAVLDAKERIRQAIDVVELIGDSIALRRQGRNFVGLCPWHDDSRPSLQVNPERQSWKCWVCNDGGDVFSFVMKKEKVEFAEALRMLADRAGVELSPRGQPTTVIPGSSDDKKTLYEAMEWAVGQFHQCLLQSGEAKPARDYLQQRSISDESIHRYQLGFSPPGWQWIIDRAKATKFSMEVLEAVGLVMKSSNSGRWYDQFRGRVVFPIRDAEHRAIAVGGRILPALADERSPKYINSPETRLYSKRENLYGFDLAKDAIGKTPDGTVVVMEGYTDVVIARQYGLDNVVAVLGTALTDRHIRLLRRFVSRITLVLDGDQAGMRRANEILEQFMAHQVDLRVVTLPDGLDPCDYLLQQGVDSFRARLANAPDALEHKICTRIAGLDPIGDPHRANLVLEELLGVIAKVPRIQQAGSSDFRLREHQFLNRLSRQFRIDEAELRGRVAELRRKTRAYPLSGASAEQESQPLRLAPIERDLFELLLRHPDAIPSVLDVIPIAALQTDSARQLFAKYTQVEAEGIMADFDRLMLEFDDPAMKSLIVELDERARGKVAFDSDVILRDLLALFERRRLEKDLRDHATRLEADVCDEADQLKLLEDLYRRRQQTADDDSPACG